MDTNEDADSDTDAFTYCNPDAQFHRDPCAKLYLHADGHGCGNPDCDALTYCAPDPYTDPYIDANADAILDHPTGTD